MILISKITATVQNKSTCFLFPFRWCSRLKLFSFFPLNFVKLEKRSSEAIKLEKFWFWEINLFKVSSEIQLFRFQVLLNWPLTSNCSIGLIQLHHSSYIWALRIRRWNGCGEWTSSNHRSFDRESCCSHHKSGKFWWSLCTLGWKDCVSFECCTRGKFDLPCTVSASFLARRIRSAARLYQHSTKEKETINSVAKTEPFRRWLCYWIVGKVLLCSIGSGWKSLFWIRKGIDSYGAISAFALRNLFRNMLCSPTYRR